MQTKKLTLLQCCPVCNSSWRGMSFEFIYRNADRMAVEEEKKRLTEENAKSDHPLPEKELRKKFPKRTPDILIQRQASTHPYRNQSRLQWTEDGKFLVCPECHNGFPVSSFADAHLLKQEHPDDPETN